MYTEDEVKEKILRYLYDFNRAKGQWTSPVRVINDLRSSDLDRIKITNNLNFLVGEKFIKSKKERVKSSGTSISLEKIMIDNKGIKLFEESKYSSKPFSSLTIQAGEGSNIVLIDGNQYGTISQTTNLAINELDKLIEYIKSLNIIEDEKRNLTGDVEAIKAQLTKSNPAKTVIKVLWSSVSTAASLSGAQDLILKIGAYLKDFVA